jgi:hypothetical protein
LAKSSPGARAERVFLAVQGTTHSMLGAIAFKTRDSPDRNGRQSSAIAEDLAIAGTGRS